MFKRHSGMRRSLALLGAAGALSWAGIAAASDQTLLPVSVCVPSPGLLAGNFGNFFNNDTTAVAGHGEARCGFTHDGALDTNDDLRVYFEDNGSAVGNNFLCYGNEVDEDWGTIIGSGLKIGCATAGGCDTDSGAFTGSNYLTLQDIRHGGAYSTAVFCGVPIKQGSAVSHLKTFLLDEQ